MAPKTEGAGLGRTHTGFLHYPTNRDIPFKTGYSWLEGKQQDDNVGPYWRVHDKLYDLTTFIHTHPGGKDWIELTRGTDITEAFESAHISSSPEKVLQKYYVKDISSARNSPYTFHQDGFYRTLKRKVRVVLEGVGRGPSWKMLLLQDGLALTFGFLALLAAAHHSYLLAVLAGLMLCETTICAHNFFHQRNNWRMYYFDLSIFSSRQWRITHGLSHHLYTNTIYDFEISMLEPFLNFLPTPSKSLVQRYGSGVYELLFMPLIVIYSMMIKIKLLVEESRSHPEHFLQLLQLGIMALVAPSLAATLQVWAVIQLSFAYVFFFLGLVAAHHHPDIYHEGDRMRQHRDWGLCQLDAVRERTEVTGNLFLVSTMFGDHSLHHLFPTVDHSKLPHLYPVFLDTCKQFGVPFTFIKQWDLVVGKYQQLANVTPNTRPPAYERKTL